MDAKYPEHEKLMKVNDKSQAVGEFLEWLLGERGLQIGEFRDRQGDWLWPVNLRTEDLLAEYFKIDLRVLEQEKITLLDSLRS